MQASEKGKRQVRNVVQTESREILSMSPMRQWWSRRFSRCLEHVQDIQPPIGRSIVNFIGGLEKNELRKRILWAIRGLIKTRSSMMALTEQEGLWRRSDERASYDLPLRVAWCLSIPSRKFANYHEGKGDPRSSRWLVWRENLLKALVKAFTGWIGLKIVMTWFFEGLCYNKKLNTSTNYRK